MSVFCAISNTVPVHPVLNKVSGSVYERQLVEKYIAEHGKDPSSGKACTTEDLIDMNLPTPLKPAPASITSVPSLIKTMQDEWDAVLLEMHQLKKSLHETRQELSHSLYQHDAACRVIARLTTERNEARNALQEISVSNAMHIAEADKQANSAGEGVAMETDGGENVNAHATQNGMPEEVLEQIRATASELVGKRKKRKKGANLAKTEDIGNMKLVQSLTSIHSASSKGVTSLALHPTDSNLLLTGGVDKKVVVYDREAEKAVHTFSDHTKKITEVAWNSSGSVVYSASADGTVKINGLGESAGVSTISCHSKGVSCLAINPAGNVVVTGSLDGTWAISDAVSGTTYAQYKVPDNSEVHAAKIHPDGLLVGTGGKDGLIKIWDITEGKSVADFTGHTDAVTDLAFSENGYYMASTCNDNTVRLWDLRMKKILNFKVFEYDGKINPHSVQFDRSGTYLAVGGQDTRVYVVKHWDELCRLEDHTGAVTKVAFGPDAGSIVSASMDRRVNIYGF
ncbi:hypothetical protein SARC_05414 [Sphaeroforma arctica JP610]|uniref:Pre-mRNA-processing factor 19 n=1 Tax=Sphaeroforma arctica JP610 TaxID=667725 RepID=A0A0L0FZP2_9EUKA|nr:hypothetical protein SARC_05414 [Sphaeroforma arctica JP610]KNC82295.1 hypothetical protein SARC_05414 [Sphaeroforma arctica JP610]|eukprot:XP_014156197.1 hypothetical protein SARC_05414 [Sphaeroforma arctica JP610]